MTQSNGIKKLKSKIQIDLVFNKGKAFRSGALIVHFINRKEGLENTHIGVGVSKRSVLLAYRRNRIKRQIRAVIQRQKKEVLRTLPPGFYMVLYKGKISVATNRLEQDFEGLLKHFTEGD